MTRKFSKFLVGAVLLVVILLAAMYVALPKSRNASEAAAPPSNASVQVSAELSDFKFTLVNHMHYSVALSNKAVTEAIVPSEYNGFPVKEIATSGFANCSQLEEVRLPQSVKTVGVNAFASDAKLKTVIMTGVETVGISAFSYCGVLETITFPDTLTTVGSNVFRNSSPTVYTNLAISNTPVWTNWYASFTGTVKDGYNDLIAEYYVNDEGVQGYSVTSGQFLASSTLYIVDLYNGDHGILPIINVGQFAFADIGTNIEALAFYSSHNYNVNIECFAFAHSDVSNVFFGDNVVFDDIGFTFWFSSVKTVVLPSTLTAIPQFMFEYCDSLESISYIGAATLDNCLSPSIVSIGDNAFGFCIALTDLHISENVAEVGSTAFWSWGFSKTQTLYIDIIEYELSWTDGWDYDCGAWKILRAGLDFNPLANESWYVSSAGNLANDREIRVPSFYQGRPVEEIGFMAFWNNESIESLIMPSITTVGQWAFEFCTNLEYLYAPALELIYDHGFSGCASLVYVDLPSVTLIDDGGFKCAESLVSINMPNVRYIGETAFAMSALNTVTLPSSLAEISLEAFYECLNLTTVYVQRVATSSNPFDGTEILTVITFDENGPTNAPNQVFFGCASLTRIYVPSASVNFYKTADNWSLYQAIIFGF